MLVVQDEQVMPDEKTPEEKTPEETIQLDQFLKLIGAVGTGGQAKRLIQGGEVMVNGKTETRRRHKLHVGDLVSLEDETFQVEAE